MKALVTTPQGPIFDTFFTQKNRTLAEEFGEVVWNESEAQFTEEELKQKIKDCDVYVTTWGAHPLDSALLDCAPNLKLLCHLCGTVVPVVSDEMWERGIKVISGNEYFARSVAEAALAYMLSGLRRIPLFTNRIRNEGVWRANGDKSEGLFYKTVGIVSYGAIAKHLVKMLKMFDVKILAYDIVDIPEEDKEKYNITQCSLEEVFASSDIVSVHTPLNDHTYHLIDDHLLSLLRRDALFINTARGGVVDQIALTSHLAKGNFYAYLDVLEKEPIDIDDPLRTLPNAFIMPHMGGPTPDMRQYITCDLLAESYGFIHEGKPLVNEIMRSRAVQMSKR